MTRIDGKYLTKVYKNGAYGLKNCSLCVNAGEFLVVVGASGSGKSTLLKVLAGTEQLSSGELYFDGIFADSIPSSKRSVSMVFQEYVLYPHMTVFDNLATPLKLEGEDEKSIYDRVMEVLRLFNLEIAADVKPKNLSGGEQQRVALAKALLKRSKIVLLDEPMSNVDEKSRWEYCHTLKKMKSMMSDSSFVYVTHNPKEALFLADRIAVMKDGDILQIASKDFLIRHFEHISSMELLGAVDKICRGSFNGESFVFDGEPLNYEIKNVDYSKLTSGQAVTLVQNGLDDECVHLFDNAGRSLSISSLVIGFDGRLVGSTLDFNEKSVELSDEYLSRLLRRPQNVKVLLAVNKFSKTLLTDCFSLIFEVIFNGGDHVVLRMGEKSFILGEKTNLQAGERIRLYYKIDDLLLYDAEDRLTCHYPIHRNIKIRVIDANCGKIELLGKRIKINKQIQKRTGYACITNSAFKLSYRKEGCAVRVLDCLDEEFINGRKMSHVAIKGHNGYISLMTDPDLTCFGKNKLWLNIIPNKIELETEEF